MYPSIMMTTNNFVDKLLLTFKDTEVFQEMMGNPIKYLERCNIVKPNEVIAELIKLKGNV